MKVAIIGGGASGMMVGAILAESDKTSDIVIFERNKFLGAKVLISGGGRCNVTTGFQNESEIMTKYTRGAKFFRNSFRAFPPSKVYEWFEDHGVRLKIEDDMRVFPQSGHGKDIVGVFENLFEIHGVVVHLEETILEIQKVANGFNIKTDKSSYIFDKVVITTGGNAYAHTGSRGDGYKFAKYLGHTITRLGPSLNSFETRDSWTKNLSGLAFRNARVFYEVEKMKHDIVGPFLFTHFGISGPLSFAVSSGIAFEKITDESPFVIYVIPDVEIAKTFEVDLIEKIKQFGARKIQNILNEFFPDRFVLGLLKILNINYDKKASELSKEERKLIVVNIATRGIELHLVKRRTGDEFVTAGGVCTDEVDSKTMESKLLPGLYFAGEILDIDGLTGGFNLQVAWATGKVVGESIIKTI